MKISITAGELTFIVDNGETTQMENDLLLLDATVKKFHELYEKSNPPPKD